MRAASARSLAPVTSPLPPVLSRVRSDLSRKLSVLALRVRLRFQPAAWLSAIPAATNAAFDTVGGLIERWSWRAASSAMRGATRAAVRAVRWRRVALVASAPFVLPAELRGALVRIFAYLAAIYAMTLLATGLFRQPDDAAVTEAAPRPLWTDVEKPWAAFELAAPGFDDDTGRYGIRRHAKGGRKDVFSFGELGATNRFMSVEIYRPGEEIAQFGAPAEEIHAHASDQGRVLGLRGSMPIASKFGRFQTFEFGIGPFGGYNCIGFLRAFDNPRVQISGLSCSMNLIVDRKSISCALDRLTLISAGSDPDIARLFAHAEQKRHFCGQRDPLLYKTPRRPADATSAISSSRLKLRGRQR